MKQQFESLAAELGIRIDYLKHTGSTNDDARSDVYAHGDIIFAERQSKGRGQRGNRWKSSGGENITFSMVLKPDFLAAQEQFMLSKSVALALTDMLESYCIVPSIKWTNDIYIGSLKVVGILIENDVCGSSLSRSIVGIGLNVNQTEFDPGLPNPISMSLAAGHMFDRIEVLRALCKALSRRYQMLKAGEKGKIEADYLAHLYLKDTPHTFRMPDGTPVEGIIRNVLPTGELIVEHPDGATRSYLFREIEY